MSPRSGPAEGDGSEATSTGFLFLLRSSAGPVNRSWRARASDLRREPAGLPNWGVPSSSGQTVT